MWKKEIIEGFGERLRNIAILAPLFDLKQKRKYPYSMVELGLAALLFIYEDMLLGEKSCTYQHISQFLRELIRSYYGDALSHEDALTLTYYLVRDGLLNEGRPHSFSYCDYESNREKEFKFNLVELDYQVRDKRVRLKLSPMGLDLLFKTKEMYNELQVSISQIFLRMQIQKGVFDGALRSVEELSLAVRNEKTKIKELEERIIRDVLQVAREKELEKRLKRVNEQLVREKKVFSQLHELIEHTLREHREGRLGAKEKEAIAKIMKVRKRLHDIIADHESLFTHKIQIQRLMNESIEAMILNAFSVKINFETEILTPFLKKRGSQRALKMILDPLFSPHIHPSFHPGLAFQEQSLQKEREEGEEDLLELEEKLLRQEEERERERRQRKERDLKDYLQILLSPLVHQEKTTVSAILHQLEAEERERYSLLLEKMDFYPFLIRLHQLGAIPLLEREEVEGSFLDELPWLLAQLLEENPSMREVKEFELEATEDIVRLPNGYVISDFIIRRRAENGME